MFELLEIGSAQPDIVNSTLPLSWRNGSRCLFTKFPASRPEWHGWVAEETVGTTLNVVNDVSRWQFTAARLADLQIASRTDAVPFLSAGAHDLRIAGLCNFVRPFFRVILDLMKRQTKTPPAVLEEPDVAVLEACVFDALALLKELAIPSCLGHLDLNPGNVIVSSDQCRFLDWAEGL